MPKSMGELVMLSRLPWPLPLLLPGAGITLSNCWLIWSVMPSTEARTLTPPAKADTLPLSTLERSVPTSSLIVTSQKTPSSVHDLAVSMTSDATHSRNVASPNILAVTKMRDVCNWMTVPIGL